AVVGVIANLSVWFALHVLFRRTVALPLLGHSIDLPDLASLDWRAALIAAVAAVLVFRLKWNVIRVLALCALAGLALGWLPTMAYR
ncbi:MAG: chromate transporter, partial [Proteobacteria bacterium]|nr:chromate transporter [Pseudomonadota bacterium]